jgi:hypothetical protein
LVASFATAKAVVGIGLGVYLTAGFIIVMEWAFNMAMLINFNFVMCQNRTYWQIIFDVRDLHLKKKLNFLFKTIRHKTIL